MREDMFKVVAERPYRVNHGAYKNDGRASVHARSTAKQHVLQHPDNFVVGPTRWEPELFVNIDELTQICIRHYNASFRTHRDAT